MKYSQAFTRDYTFYRANLDTFIFSGKHSPQLEWDPLGHAAKWCFYIYDSTGKMLPCWEPGLLQKILVCKASVNLHIKLWAQGIAQGVLCPPELDEILTGYAAPDWVAKAVLRQGERRLLEQSRRVECQSKI